MEKIPHENPEAKKDSVVIDPYRCSIAYMSARPIKMVDDTSFNHHMSQKYIAKNKTPANKMFYYKPDRVDKFEDPTGESGRKEDL